jgi:lysozyme family protein
MSDFAEALALVLQMEGGRVDNPRDPGGRTNQGVTQRIYDAWRQRQGRPRRSVYAITPDEVESIYHDGFAKPVCFDQLPPGVAYAVFDAAVNSGPARAVRWLQGAADLHTTGRLDTAVLASIAARRPVPTIDRLCDLRLGLLRHLPGWAPFGRGWSRRIAFVRSHAKGLAQAAPPAG